jgi:hypothetical protein
MQMRINLLLISWFLFSINIVVSQSISNDVIGSSGMHSVGSNGTMLSWTIGEPIVNTQGGATYILTQGFHQPWNANGSTSYPIIKQTTLEINVYPNPVRDILTVSISNNMDRIYFDLYDISGRLIRHEEATANQTKITFPIRFLSAGSYLLHARNNDFTINKTYQLQKLR